MATAACVIVVCIICFNEVNPVSLCSRDLVIVSVAWPGRRLFTAARLLVDRGMICDQSGLLSQTATDEVLHWRLCWVAQTHNPAAEWACMAVVHYIPNPRTSQQCHFDQSSGASSSNVAASEMRCSVLPLPEKLPGFPPPRPPRTSAIFGPSSATTCGGPAHTTQHLPA